MAKGKATDAEIRALVIEKKINSLESAKSISDELNKAWFKTSERTVSRIIKQELAIVGEKSTVVANLIDTNNNLQSSADDLIAELIKNKDEKITLGQLTSLRESTFKQNQLLTGEPTDNVQVNDYKNLTTAELLAMKNKGSE